MAVGTTPSPSILLGAPISATSWISQPFPRYPGHQAGGELPQHPAILDLANAIIAGARDKYTKCLFTRRPTARVLASSGRRRKTSSPSWWWPGASPPGGGTPLSQMRCSSGRATLLRLEIELVRVGIPFMKFGASNLWRAPTSRPPGASAGGGQPQGHHELEPAAPPGPGVGGPPATSSTPSAGRF